ncbi:MAG: Rpn family recombination-promoting nuclease/putative transposase [Clostridium sp.]|nr:Rpn family recombination-promoting nuclease/putative transposase [Clostridium sp.]
MENLGTFINLMTDFGFKRLFGTEEFKAILIRFLNVLFSKEGLNIIDVTFHDKEILPADAGGKRIVYDVYCTNHGQNEHFILEMQQVYHSHFEKRVMYYLAKALSNQGHKGSVYDFSPVYGIFFVNFQLRHLEKRFLHDFQMREAQTQEIFSNLLRLQIVCLEEVKDKWEDCESELEKTVYLIKNMHLMDKNSKAYKSGEYAEMFNAAEITSLAKEEVVAYRQSKRYFDDQVLYREAALAEGEEEGRRKGLLEGRLEGRRKGLLEGRLEGRLEERKDIEKKMLDAGIDPTLIRRILDAPSFDS